MKVFCRVENSLSRNLPDGKGGFGLKTFQFTSGVPAEIPDEYAKAVLETRSNQGLFFSEDQWKEYAKENKVAPDPILDESKSKFYALRVEKSNLEKVEDAPPEPVLDDANFTREELETLEVPALVAIAKEMGFKAVMPTWKKETLVNKILGI